METSDSVGENLLLDTPEGARNCSQCGLTVPPELDACPNDGTVVAKTAQELLSNRYEFIDVIGKGGMSVIYKARHKLMQSTVAIKLLQEKLTQDKSSFLRFKQEAQASSRLNHPSIIKVLDFGVLEHGTAYLVMDYIEGHSLSDVIAKEGRINPERAVDLFMQICEGLAHAHANGVLHRDLKPSNVLIYRDTESRERAKIVDFGIAKVLAPDGVDANKLTSTGEVFGSPLYMSPEQCMGLDVDARSDVYSMGTLMYESLCGKPPILGTNPMETIFKQLNEVPEPLTKHVKHPLAPALSAVLERAMEKQREDRYQSVNELLEDLHKAVRGQKIKGHRKVPYARLAGIGALAAVVGIWFWMSDSPIPQSVHEFGKNYELIYWQEGKATDADCEELATYPHIDRIELRGNHRITSKGMSYFLKKHPELEQLYLDGTSIDDNFIHELANSPCKDKITKLAIGRSHVTSKSFPELKALQHLQELALLDMNLKNEDMHQLPELPRLTTLKLDCNPHLTDEALSIAVPKYPMLNILTVRQTGVTNASIDIVGELTKDRPLSYRVWGTKVDPIANTKYRDTLNINPSKVVFWWNDPKKGGLPSDSIVELEEKRERRAKKKHKMLPSQQNDA